LKPKKTLPIYNPADITNPELVDSSTKQVLQLLIFLFYQSKWKDNNLKKDYEGKIYVMTFFFTTCATICPK
jgi:protein SCO1/2